MSVDKEIEKTARRLEELKKRKERIQKTAAMQFFKKNKIDHLLEMPEELKEFTNEVMSVIKKYAISKTDKIKNEKDSVKTEE